MKTKSPLKLPVFALASCPLTSLADGQPPSLVNSLGLKMIHVKPGSFSMGSTDGEFDERPVRRLISDDGQGQELDGGAWTRGFNMDSSHGEPRGYLCFTQTPDGMIHLLSSAVHYQFNLAWLKARTPAIP